MNRTYYPAFIDLKGRQCVVVGGGGVAERKVLTLLSSGARVTVISPAITGALKRQKERGAIKHVKRAYREGDLRGAFLAIAATSDEELNKMVSEEASCLVNVVDVPEMANFIVPSTVMRGPLTIAISTSGASPALARTIRSELEFLYGADFGRFLSFLGRLRKRVIREIPDKKTRERFLKGVASKEILAALREQGLKAAQEMVLRNYPSAKEDTGDLG